MCGVRSCQRYVQKIIHKSPEHAQKIIKGAFNSEYVPVNIQIIANSD